MTVPNETAQDIYPGNGTTDTYAYTFRVIDQSHLEVIISDSTGLPDVTLILNTDYTVTGVGTAGGNVVLTAGVLATGKQITINRKLPLVQNTDIKDQGPYHPEIIEASLDYQMMVLQMQKIKTDRQLALPSTEVPSAGAQMLPTVAQRANKFLGFDSLGNIIAAVGVAVSSVSSFMAGLLNSADAPTARTALGFAGTGGTVQTANIESAGLATAAYAAGSVTLAKLGADALAFLNPPGTIQMFGGAVAPTGWILCQGQSELRASFPALFTAIGTAFGSADGTHFTLPDFRNLYPRGVTGVSLDVPGLVTAASTDTISNHTHTIGNTNLASESAGAFTYATATNTGSNGGHTHATVVPANLGINYIIKT